MATIKTATLNANSFQILNAIRAQASSGYQDRIPVATQDNLKQIGTQMLSFQSLQNEFLNSLVNRIGLVIVTSKMYTNPYKMLKRGLLEFGETIEEIFVSISKAHQFDQSVAENEVYKREIPDVSSAFHRINRKDFYKTTVSHDMIRQAFMSINGVTDLISRIIDSVYTANEYDEFLLIKQVIANAITDGRIVPVVVPTADATTAKQIVSTIKGISNKMEFMSTNYNAYGFLTHSTKQNQILIVDAEFDAIIDVEVLASAFNMSKVEFMGQRLLIDNFNNLTGVSAVLIDREWLMIYDTMIEFKDKYNEQGLYWNYWLHVWQVYSNSPFANGIAFVTTTPAITSVAVTPDTVTLSKGSSQIFSATVVSTGFAPTTVIWELSGTDNVTSDVDYNGRVSIANNEVNTTLTLTATSIFDNTKTATATITIS